MAAVLIAATTGAMTLYVLPNDALYRLPATVAVAAIAYMYARPLTSLEQMAVVDTDAFQDWFEVKYTQPGNDGHLHSIPEIVAGYLDDPTTYDPVMHITT